MNFWEFLNERFLAIERFYNDNPDVVMVVVSLVLPIISVAFGVTAYQIAKLLVLRQ